MLSCCQPHGVSILWIHLKGCSETKEEPELSFQPNRPRGIFTVRTHRQEIKKYITSAVSQVWAMTGGKSVLEDQDEF